MPMVLEHIDGIARRLGRDVLVAMPPPAVHRLGDLDFLLEESEQTAWEEVDTRRKAIAFLEMEGIAWTPCFGLEVPGLIFRPYLGEIFIDVANDPTDVKYGKVCAFFEHPGGTPRHEDFRLFLVPLDLAVATGERAKVASDGWDI